MHLFSAAKLFSPGSPGVGQLVLRASQRPAPALGGLPSSFPWAFVCIRQEYVFFGDGGTLGSEAWVHLHGCPVGYFCPTGFIAALCPITFSVSILLPLRDLITFKLLATKATSLADMVGKSSEDIPA